MIAVLGIDAAWADENSSGVALIRKPETGEWEHVASAPSCQSFIQLTRGNAVNWDTVPRGGAIEPNELLDAIAERWPELNVKVIAIDIPVANHKVRAQRCCDRAINATFQRAWAGTQTPTETLPGPLSDRLMGRLDQANYPLKTCDGSQANHDTDEHTTIEVYPHPAIVRLLNLKCRLPYKDGKKSRYWRKADLPTRRRNLAANLRKLSDGLSVKIHGIPPDRKPTEDYAQGRRSLKKFEDTLDALVCAWVGACYIDRDAECFGDHNAAIWVPARNATTPAYTP